MLKHKALLLCSLIALGTATMPAHARVNLDVDIGVAPPAPQVEVVPAARPGYVWTPGYWNWDGGRHVWVGGTWVAERPGYAYAPARWEERNGRHHFVAGHWEHR
jgi:hypothetical protein